MKSTHDSWALWVRALRDQLRLKQEAFAARLGVSQAYVSRLESSGFDPSAEVAARLLELKQEAERRDPFIRIEAAVAASEGIESIVFVRDGRVHLKAFSAGFRGLDPMFAAIADGDLLEGRVGADADEHFALLKAAGGFSADIESVRNVWVSETAAGPVFMSATSVPIPSADGTWHIKSTHVAISEQEFDRRQKFEIRRR